MAFYGANNTLLIDDDGIVISSFDSDGVVAESDGFNLFDTEFIIRAPLEVQEYQTTPPVNGMQYSGFAKSVAVGSGRIVIGSPDLGSSPSSLVDGGAVFVYDLNGNDLWYHKLSTPDGFFGGSVAAGGGSIGIATGDNPSSDYGFFGAVDLDGTGIEIYNSDNILQRFSGTDIDYLCQNVAMGCGKLVLGLERWDSGSGYTPDHGAIEIFDIYGNNQRDEYLIDQTPTRIFCPDPVTSSKFFGQSVAVGNGRILVGAQVVDSNGYPAYLFDLEGNLIKKIKPDNFDTDGGGFAAYPNSTAIACGKIAIGAPGLGFGSSGPSGKAYIYDLNGNKLWETPTFSDSNVRMFGYSIAIGSNKVFVGDPYFNSPEKTYDSARGKVWAYSLDGTLEATHESPDSDISTNRFLRYGFSLAAGNNRLVVGTNPLYTSTALPSKEKAYGYKLDGTIDTYYEDVLDTVGNNKWA